MAQITVEEFRNFFKYYNGEAHQIKAVDMLYADIDCDFADHLSNDSDWIKQYRNQLEPEKVIEDGVLIDVPYQSQLDNASGTGYRECFSSSCAMVAMYYGKIKNDDEYNLVRAKYGDSTDAAAQVQALRELGLEATFVTSGTTDALRRLLNEGRPVPVGWLHKGPVGAPTGGGHWSVVVGYKEGVSADGTWIVNDPNGEANLVSGGYTDNRDGSNQEYSYANWNPRWIVSGEGDGWYLDVKEPAVQKPTGKQPTVTSQAGIDLIKEFEGCVLEAYVDAVGVLTIGYGHTGSDVKPGMTITEAEAEALLKEDLERFEQAVSHLIKVPFNQNEFDATVSFTFNCGAGALDSSTFKRRINAGEHKATCFREEFPKWVNGSNGPLPGLVRRRDAEVALAVS